MKNKDYYKVAVQIKKYIINCLRRTGYRMKYVFIISKKKILNNGVLIITHDFEYAGAQVLLYNIVKYLVDENIPVIVIGWRFGPLVEQYGKICKVIVCNKKDVVIKAETLHKKKGYNRVLCNTVVTGRYVRELKDLGYKVVSLVHEMETLIKEEHLECECNLISSNADTIVFPSAYVYESFKKCLKDPVCQGNVKIRHQGLFNQDVKSLTRYEARRQIERKYSLNLNDMFIVIGVGTACLRKGFDLFLDMAMLTYNLDKQVYFIWVGDKTEEIYNNKREQYGQSAFKNVFLAGYISEIDILYSFYKTADMLCLCSREEPFGSIVLEAFNSYTPVIAFDGRGGYMDMIEDKITGFLVPPYRIDLMVKQIIEIKKNRNLYNDVAKNSFERVKEDGFDRYCEFIIGLLEW